MNMKFLHFITKFTVKIIICYDLLFAISSLADTNVQLLIKKKAIVRNRVKFTRGQVTTNTSYIEFLEKIPVVIDRTLFINFILDIKLGEMTRAGIFAVSAPLGWGKSSILKMIDFYFSPELDEKLMKIKIKKTKAYKFFEKGEITVNGEQHKFTPYPLISSKNTGRELDTYIAQHPVISFDLSNLYQNGDTFKSVVEKFFFIARDFAIKKHIRVINKLCTSKRNVDGETVESVVHDDCYFFYRTYHTKPSDVTELETVGIIAHVLHLLHSYYKKQVIVLIDEHLLHNLYIPVTKDSSVLSPSLRYQILSFYDSILSETSLTEVLFTLSTGIVPVNFVDDRSRVHRMTFHNFMDKDLYQFYGVEHEVAMKLMEYAGFDDATRKQQVANFDRYETSSDFGVTTFNPYSLLETIYGASDPYPWLKRIPTTFLNFLAKMNGYIRYALKRLLFGRCLTSYVPTSGFTFHPRYFVKIGYNALDPHNNKDGTESLFLNYLVQMGILTVTSKTKYQAMKLKDIFRENSNDEKYVEHELCFTIPNLENSMIISKVLIDYDMSHCNILETSLTLAKMLYNHSITCDTFKKNLETFLNERGRNTINGSEMYYHTLLLITIVLPLETIFNYKNLADYQLNEHLSTPDIVLHNETHGGIFKVKYNAPSIVFDEAYDEQLPRYGAIFHQFYPRVKHLRLMLILIEDNEARNGTNRITVTMKERCLNTSTDFKKIYKTKEAEKALKKTRRKKKPINWADFDRIRHNQ